MTHENCKINIEKVDIINEGVDELIWHLRGAIKYVQSVAPEDMNTEDFREVRKIASNYRHLINGLQEALIKQQGATRNDEHTIDFDDARREILERISRLRNAK